ncbi:unnamed protein product [Boreogadus saida]
MSSTPDPATLQEVFLTWEEPNPTVDLHVSMNKKTVTGGKDYCPPPGLKSNTYKWPQVLSNESLTGSCSWVFEWKGQNVTVGVASALSLDDPITQSPTAWSLNCYEDYYDAVHNGDAIRLPVPPAKKKKIRVDMDTVHSTVSFFQVTSGQHLHTFYVPKTDKPLKAVALVWVDCFVTLI